jgi:pimeloyl-ACP methyl ester carboxylesterase
MRRYEIIFNSVNVEGCPKPITALVVEPDKFTANTGLMLFTHGWGCNRYYDVDKIEFTCDRYNLVCVSVEYRDCGFEFNPATGAGYCRPYDTSFYQVFDVLNGLRTVLNIHPQINRKRIFHYARSQGGHIALIGSMFAPHTFAALLLSSPVTHLDKNILTWPGRDFSPAEFSVRNMIEHADRIRCPLILDHGTNDADVPHDIHTQALAATLRSLGRNPSVRYYPGGRHDLTPTTTMFKAYRTMTAKSLGTLKNKEKDIFSANGKIDIPCADKTLHIDWSKSTDDVQLFSWNC